MIDVAPEPNAQAEVCIAGGITCMIAVALGVQQGNLIAGMAGALFALAYIRPHHWGNWLEIPSGASHWWTVYFWARRIGIVAFILIATAIVSAIGAEMAQIASAEGAKYVPDWLAKVNPKAISLIFAFFGQSLIPFIIKWIVAKGKAGAQ